MTNIFKEIENEIAKQMIEIDKLRGDLDAADASDVQAQNRLLQEISVRVIRLKAVQDLYRGLRGE